MNHQLEAGSEPDLDPDPFAQLPGDEPAATTEDTRRWYLNRARSGYATIRRHFLTEEADKPQPGALAHLVRTRSSLALDFYLLQLALARVQGADTLPTSAWARMLSHGDQQITSSRVLRAADQLRDVNLLGRESNARAGTTFHLLREDGSGQAWSLPTGKEADLYFTLPFDFWVPGMSSTLEPVATREPLFSSLTMPGKAILLIMLKETSGRPTTNATLERMSDLYGISASTLTRGLSELKKLDLTDERGQKKTAPAGFNGLTWIHHRTLLHPFSYHHRDQLKKRAATAGRKRAESKKGGD